MVMVCMMPGKFLCMNYCIGLTLVHQNAVYYIEKNACGVCFRPTKEIMYIYACLRNLFSHPAGCD